MGDINQLIFIRKHADKLQGPFLEVGAKNYGSTQDFRTLFAQKDKYIGVDMEDGPGVDVVLDLTEDFEKINTALSGQQFGTIFCMSVMEHCHQPFKMAENLTRLLKQNGHIFVWVPFSWKVHAYPNDYWRFTPEGVKTLFPKVQFDTEQSLAFTSKKNEFQKLDSDLNRVSFSFGKHCKNGHILRGISASFLKMLSHIGILNWLVGYRYLYPPTNISMVGKLKNA